MAWLELLEQPEMGGFILLTSVLKQACLDAQSPGLLRGDRSLNATGLHRCHQLSLSL